MGHKHSRDEILQGALETAFADGLSQVTFGRVARRLGINDRTVVYYFPSKNDLVSDVLAAIGAQLQAALASAFTARAADHTGIVRAAWPILARPDADAIFALFFEANGLAAAGRTPYVDVVPQLVTAWIEWAALYIDGPAAHRRAEAGDDDGGRGRGAPKHPGH